MLYFNYLTVDYLLRDYVCFKLFIDIKNGSIKCLK